MAEKRLRTIRIEWVRSGIGFSYRAKEAVRGLGLRRLHQVVERPDTPEIRGLVSKVAHLVKVVERPVGTSRPARAEYNVSAAEVPTPSSPPLKRGRKRKGQDASSPSKATAEVGQATVKGVDPGASAESSASAPPQPMNVDEGSAEGGKVQPGEKVEE